MNSSGNNRGDVGGNNGSSGNGGNCSNGGNSGNGGNQSNNVKEASDDSVRRKRKLKHSQSRLGTPGYTYRDTSTRYENYKEYGQRENKA